jgi:hypothetical protein
MGVPRARGSIWDVPAYMVEDELMIAEVELMHTDTKKPTQDLIAQELRAQNEVQNDAADQEDRDGNNQKAWPPSERLARAAGSESHPGESLA